MALADLTSRNAVDDAIGEFDKLGRDAFLGKYGFGPARSYYLVHGDARYDSKAIVGAAHGFQFPDLGPLTPDEFSGGEITVATKLRSLGFVVSAVESGRRLPAIWALCANPKRYRIREAVQHNEIDYWTIGGSKVRAGDHAFIWQTLDASGKRGIVAFAEVLGDPEPRTDEGNPYWVKPADGLIRALRVPVSYSVSEKLPLWVDDRDAGTFLRSLSVAKAQGGTVFRVSPEQWGQLTQLVPYSGTPVAEIEDREQLRHRARPRGGQGFGLSTAERKAVEDYAMRLGIAHFMREWDTVTDVSARSSYDLLCRRGAEELRVEIKGTTTTGHQVILTRNEVNEAKRQGYALFVVSEIVLSRSSGSSPKTSGGFARLFSPWSPIPDALQPIRYLCEVDIDKGIVVSCPVD